MSAPAGLALSQWLNTIPSSFQPEAKKLSTGEIKSTELHAKYTAIWMNTHHKCMRMGKILHGKDFVARCTEHVQTVFSCRNHYQLQNLSPPCDWVFKAEQKDLAQQQGTCPHYPHHLPVTRYSTKFPFNQHKQKDNYLNVKKNETTYPLDNTLGGIKPTPSKVQTLSSWPL